MSYNTEDKIEEAKAILDEINVEHLVINFKQHPTVLECKNCGETDVLRTGISLTYCVNLCYAWRMTHAMCESPTPEGEHD